MKKLQALVAAASLALGGAALAGCEEKRYEENDLGEETAELGEETEQVGEEIGEETEQFGEAVGEEAAEAEEWAERRFEEEE